MTGFNEPKSPLTSARMFDKVNDAKLADWLDNDAQALDGQPGRNNHVAATRAAAERLRQIAEQADREPSADEAVVVARVIRDHDEERLTCYDHDGTCCPCGKHDMSHAEWEFHRARAALLAAREARHG